MSTESDNKRPLEAEEKNGDHKKQKTDDPLGTVLFSGATDFAEVGRKGSSTLPRSANTIWKPMRVKALLDVDVVRVVSGPSSVHCIAISRDGKVYTWGRNEKGQLGLGHSNDRKCPTLVDSLKDQFVVDAAAGRNHTLFLTKDGSVYACGDNRSGQSGGSAKETTITTPRLITYDGAPAKKVACGAEFSGFIDKDGNLWTWGHPEYGQLGHNSEGSYLEKAGKVNFDFVYTPTRVVLFVEKDPKTKASTPILGVKVVEVTAGFNHMVAIDDKNRAYSWGFGGYGRLGHSETGNELVPRMIKFFDGPRRGVTSAVAGGQFTLAQAEIPGTTYMWGQYHSTKEANMYPKPIQDLSGWMDIRSIACSGKGWMVSADEDTCIGAVPSPGYGELACGSNMKSSAAPTMIKSVADLHIAQLAMGVCHTIFIAKPANDKQKKKLEAFEVLDQEKLDD